MAYHGERNEGHNRRSDVLSSLTFFCEVPGFLWNCLGAVAAGLIAISIFGNLIYDVMVEPQRVATGGLRLITL